MVLATASSSLCTVNWSLLTAALAEARFASRVAVLTAVLAAVELSLALEDEPLDCDSPPLLWGELVLEEVVRVGSVEVVFGVVLVAGVVVAPGVVALGEVA